MGKAGGHTHADAHQIAQPCCGRGQPAPAVSKLGKECATDGTVKGGCGRLEALNGARRRGVVLDLVVDLEPIPLGVRHNDPAVLLIEDHGRRVGEPPFAL
jgi:hypothetical protein